MYYTIRKNEMQRGNIRMQRGNIEMHRENNECKEEPLLK